MVYYLDDEDLGDIKDKVNLVVRIERSTKQPLICWRESPSLVGVYFTNERYHGEVCNEWYYTETYPVCTMDEAKRYFDEYVKDWNDYNPTTTPQLRRKLK